MSRATSETAAGGSARGSAGAGRLWGGRFAEGPDAAAWELGRSTHFDVRLWREDLDGSRAHADELHRVGLLADDDHAAILAALGEIAGELASGSFAFDDGDEDLHGAVERRLVELAGDAGGRLRAGRSRNDQIVSDLRRFVVRATGELVVTVRALQATLADQADAHADALAPGFTHLQRAQPITLGFHLMAHAWALDRDVGRLRDAASRAAVEPLGSGALAGLTLGLDPLRYTEALGATRPAENAMDAVADRDFAVEFLAACALLGVHLSRLGEEIVLWSSVEFGWVRVGDAFSTGSSIMPQKRNPDVAELVRGKAGRLIGDLVALLVTLKGLPLAYDRDLQEDKEPVLDAVDTLGLVLPALTGTVASLTFDTERIAAGAARGHALATDVAEALVRAGVPFRQAHEQVGEVVARCDEEDRDLADLTADELVAALPVLEALDDPGALLDPRAAVARRDTPGGTAPDSVRGQVTRLRERLAAG